MQARNINTEGPNKLGVTINRLKLKPGTVDINLRNEFLIILIVSIRHTLKVTVDGKGNSVNIKSWPKSVLQIDTKNLAIAILNHGKF
jgi:hypothetical protein